LASVDHLTLEINRFRNYDELELFKEWQALGHVDRRSFSEYLQNAHAVRRFKDHDYHYDFGE